MPRSPTTAASSSSSSSSTSAALSCSLLLPEAGIGSREWDSRLDAVPYYRPEHPLASHPPVVRHCRLSVLRPGCGGGDERAGDCTARRSQARSGHAALEKPQLRPVVVFVHGGSWRRGDRRCVFYAGDLQAYADRHDCLVVSVGYRVSRWRWPVLFILYPLLALAVWSLVTALLACPLLLTGSAPALGWGWAVPPLLLAGVQVAVAGGWPAGSGDCRPHEPVVAASEMASDVANALQYVSEHAVGWGGDRSRVHLAGHSAGAHLCSLVLSDPSVLREVGLKRSHLLTSVALISGIYDPEMLQNHFPWVVRWLSRHLVLAPAFGARSEGWAASSPAHLLAAQCQAHEAAARQAVATAASGVAAAPSTAHDGSDYGAASAVQAKGSFHFQEQDPWPPVMLVRGAWEGKFFSAQLERFERALRHAVKLGDATSVVTLVCAGKTHAGIVKHLGHRSGARKDQAGVEIAGFFGLSPPARVEPCQPCAAVEEETTECEAAGDVPTVVDIHMDEVPC